MHVVIDLYHHGDEAYGQAWVEGAGQPVLFSSWLDLLRLLERPPPPPEPRPDDRSGAGPTG